MHCKEFKEISEAFMSDELLVETNKEAYRHLKGCAKCRTEFAAKRELRQKTRNAVRNASDFEIDHVFASRLRAELKGSALKRNGLMSGWFSQKVLVATVAVSCFVAAFGFVLLNWTAKSDGNSIAQNPFNNLLTQISSIASGNHKDCALEKLQQWESMSKKDYAQKAMYTENVVKPLQAKFSGDVEMLHVHECSFEGKEFSHVILRSNGHIISVFVDKSDVVPRIDSGSTINSRKENGLQVASFEKSKNAVIVVSDLSETENVSAARVLSDTFIAHS